MRSSLMDKRILNENEPKQRKQPGYSPSFQSSSEQAQSLHFTRLGQDSEQVFTFLPREGWLPLILLAIALYSVVIVIVQANWVNHSEFFYLFPIIGLLIGFLVAKIPMVPQILLHILACFIGYMLAEVSSMMAFHTSWMLVVSGLKAAFTGQMAMNSSSLSEIVFFFYLSFLCFFLGYFGSWLIYRACLPWLVALVYGSIMLVNLNYVKSEFNVFLLVMLGALILLIARIQLSTQFLQWSSEGFYTDKTWLRKITGRCMQFACMITLVTVVFSWLLPIQAQPTSGKALWATINAAWSSAVSEKFPWAHGNFSNLASENVTNYFSDQLTISSSVHLPAGEVLFYKSSDSKSHYLENATFDSFNGTTWTISGTDITSDNYVSNAILPSDVVDASGAKITTRVTMDQSLQGAKNYLFAPAQPVVFNVPTQISRTGNPRASTATSWAQATPVVAKSSYSVSSQLASKTSLASIPLPADNLNYWMSDPYYNSLSHAYLQPPQDLTPEVEQTVLAWTNNDTNMYAALQSIESHFARSGVFTYSIDNKAIPAHTDVVDWLLKTRVGYCTYYASAMVVMARLLQIPTRLVTGFSAGKYDADRKVWSVQGGDAHSWVQAYFPGHGWIDFDPTPGFSTTSLNATNQAATPVPTPAVKATSTPKVQPTTVAHARPTPVNPQKQKQSPDTTSTSLSLWGALGLLFLSLVFFVSLLVLRQRQRRHESQSMISGLYWRACHIAKWVGLGPRSWQTPYEYTRMLSRHWPAEDVTLWRLTDLYVRERWGRAVSPQEYETIALQHSWPSLPRIFWHFLLRKKKK